MVPQADKRFSKLLKASDGSMIFLHTGFFKVSDTNLQNGKSITEIESGPAKGTEFPDGSLTVASKGHGGVSLRQPTPSGSGCRPWA